MARQPKFSIVLPCYNEEETLPSLIARFETVFAGREDVEVIIVNNGSRDGTAECLAAEIQRPDRGFVRCVTVSVNQGYGFGIMAGLREARGAFMGWTHADTQYDPAIVVEGLQLLVSAPDPDRTLVRGWRRGRNLFDVAFTAGMSVVASMALGVELRDINAQPKLFPRAFLELMRHPPHDFSLDLYALFQARRHGFSLLELPVRFGARRHGEAKGGGGVALKWKLTRRTLAFIRKLRNDLYARHIE